MQVSLHKHYWTSHKKGVECSLCGMLVKSKAYMPGSGLLLWTIWLFYLQGTWQATLMPKLFLVHIVQSLSRQRYSWTSTRADTLGRGNMNAVFVERGFLRKEKWRTTNSSTGTRGATLATTVESLLPETHTWEYTWKCTQREGKYHQNQQEGIDKVMLRVFRNKELSNFLLFSGSLQVLESCLHWSPRQLWYIRTMFWWNVPLMFETRLSF